MKILLKKQFGMVMRLPTVGHGYIRSQVGPISRRARKITTPHSTPIDANKF